MFSKLFTNKVEIPEEVQGIFTRKDLERLLKSLGYSRAEAKRKTYLLKELGLTITQNQVEDKKNV